MGVDYECNCRNSGGNWYLCRKHERELEEKLKMGDKHTLKKLLMAYEKIEKIDEEDLSMCGNLDCDSCPLDLDGGNSCELGRIGSVIKCGINKLRSKLEEK